MNQKGFTPIFIVISAIVLILLGGSYYFGTQTQKDKQPIQQNESTKTVQPSPSDSPSIESKQVVSSDKTSPSGEYMIVEETVGDGQTITIKNKQGEVITDNIITQNEKGIGYGTKIMCQCGTSFKGWVDNTHFAIKIVNGGGEEYEYIVDASTGKVNESSFKKIL